MSDHGKPPHTASRGGDEGGVGLSSSESGSENEDAGLRAKGSKRKRPMNVT